MLENGLAPRVSREIIIVDREPAGHCVGDDDAPVSPREAHRVDHAVFLRIAARVDAPQFLSCSVSIVEADPPFAIVDAEAHHAFGIREPAPDAIA